MSSATYHVVAIGGGGGATQALHAVESFATRRTAVIAVTDTGRSTGLARAIGGIPAPGDLRATLAAFASDRQLAALLQHRMRGDSVPQLEGMAFGNLMIAMLAQVSGDFASAIATVARLVGATVEVLPVATANTQLCAELADGALVEGEFAVRGLGKAPIARLFLRDAADAYPAALEAIRAADLVVLGPGSLFTTVLADLQFAGVVPALRETRGKVIYICNSTTQPGQTDGYRAVDHVARIVETLGPGVVDAAIINQSNPDPEALQTYAAEGLHLLMPGDAELAQIAALGVRAIVHDLTAVVGERRNLWNKQDTVRYDTATLAAILRAEAGV